MFSFYSDPALTTPLSMLSVATLIGASGSTPVSAVVYFGKPAVGRVVTPSVGDQIVVTPTDSNPSSGLPAGAIKLALTEPGLAAAIAGAPLAIGSSLSSGVENAVAVWVSVDAADALPGSYADLSLVVSNLMEADDV